MVGSMNAGGHRELAVLADLFWGDVDFVIRECDNKTSLTSLMRKTRSQQQNENWQVQTAKAKFSEVFRRARSEGPQRITRQGKDGVVMIAEEHYEQLVGRSHQPTSLVKFFRESPLVGADLDLERDRTPTRDVDL
jgi:antitoxin Phd